MSESRPPLSEAEELDAFLAHLESGGKVREIAGWESGFPALDKALNGILPGLYLLIGPPSCGKTAFAKQLCDQVASHNSVPALFFSFTENKKDLRIRTLARLSGLENREIRRGSGFLLHWYGFPKRQNPGSDEMPLSWERLRKTAEEAKSWLDFVYLAECNEKTGFNEIAGGIQRIKEIRRSEQVMAVVDDSQRLGTSDLSLDGRLPLVSERLRGLAGDLKVPLLATWPELKREGSGSAPQEWAERVVGADVILVMEEDKERTKKSTEPKRAITLHTVKNRGGEGGTLAFDFSPPFSRFTEVHLGSAS